MKKYPKFFFGCFCLLLIGTFFIDKTDAVELYQNEIGFNLRMVDSMHESGQVRRAYFNIQNGINAAPVCLSLTIQYDTLIFYAVGEEDISACDGLNKDISVKFDQALPDIIGVMIGVEEYTDAPISNGDLFYIDFRVKPGAAPGENSISFCLDDTIGPNQASNSSADLLQVKVVNNMGELWVVDNGAIHRPCFITIVR
ncbi:MAG: hypothetical protein ACMUIP_00955 [bacterium]